MSDARDQLTGDAVECDRCNNYRPQASFVDAYKYFDRSQPRVPIMKALQDIRKEETKVLESEVEVQFELLRAEEKDWWDKPRLAPLCVAFGGQFIAALKNRDGHCPDFEPALNRQGRACHTCQFIVRPVTQIGDRRVPLTASMNESSVSYFRQLNKEQEDADATAQAMEIEQSFYGNGRMPVVSFLPSCAVQFTQGERHVVPFCNLRNDCPEYRSLMPIPAAVVEMIKRDAGRGNQRALDYSIELARFIANADAEHPSAFVTELTNWVKGDSQRTSVVPWTAKCLVTRWTNERGTESEKAALKTLVETSLRKIGVDKTQGELVPVLAGCDVYEWGMLAALSRTGEEPAMACANAICQQLAEFLVTVVSPIEAAECIEGIGGFVAAEALFSTTTIELTYPFLRRLQAHAIELRLAAGVDLVSHFERFLARVSYPVASWLRLLPKDAAGIGMIDLQLAEATRQRIVEKVKKARHNAALILNFCTGLKDPKQTQKDRADFLLYLLETNEAAVARDFQEQTQVRDAVNTWAHNKAGNPFAGDLIFNLLVGNMQNQMDQERYKAMQAQELSSRWLIANLLLRRGTEPITPTALELQSRTPQLDRIPETIDEALREPTYKTVEAFHAGRFPKSNQSTAASLALARRIAAPCFVP